MSEPVSHSGDSAARVHIATHGTPGVLFDARTVREQVVLFTRFASDCAPGVPVGEEVSVRVESPRFSRPVEAHSSVLARHQSAEAIEYELAATRAESPLLAMLANRRASVRVRPDDGAPVQLLLRANECGPRRPLPVLDISGTGLGTVAPRALEQELVDAYRVWVELRLPGEPERLELEARILHRRARGAYVQYGLEFDAQREGFDAVQSRLFRYVSRREAEELARRTLAAEERRAS